jgi:hypothetical protein
MSALLLAAVPNAWAYVAFAYLTVFGFVIGFAVWVLVRGRKVGQQLPPEERTWS